MSRPETAMEPSMDEILASIRKIIAEEPATGTRPKPAERPAPMVPARAPAPMPERPQQSAPIATTGIEDRSGPDAADATDAIDPFAAPAAAPREPMFQSERQPAAVPATSSTRVDVPTPRAEPQPMPSSDNDVLFGRLAEALRGGPATSRAPVAVPSPASTVKPSMSAPITSDLDDLDDLLVPPAASAPGSGAATDADEPNTTSASGLNLGAIVPGHDRASARSSTGRDSEAMKTSHASMNGLRQAFDDEIEEILADDVDDVSATSERDADADEASGVSRAGPIGAIAVPAEALQARDEVAKEAAGTEASIERELEDLEGAEAAKSAFGALMAGLAASSSSSSSSASAAADAVAAAPVVEGAAPDMGSNKVVAKVASEMRASIEANAGRNEAKATERAHEPTQQATSPKSSAEISSVPHAPKVVAASLPFAGNSTAAPTSAKASDVVAVPSKPTVKAEGDEVAPPVIEQAAAPAASGLPQVAVAAGLAATLGQPATGSAVGVRTVEDIVAELLRPMLREWLAENMPRMVEKALRIELAEGLKTVNPSPTPTAKRD